MLKKQQQRKTSSVVATVDILSIPLNVRTPAFSVLDQGVVCSGVGFFPSSFLTDSKNISIHKKLSWWNIKIFWSSSFRNLGIVVWKFNTKDLFSEASGTCRTCKDWRGKRRVKWFAVWESQIPALGATGTLWSCPEKGRHVSAWIDYITSRQWIPKENKIWKFLPG